MAQDRRSQVDFERARHRGFWRRLRRWLGGRSNQLLPFGEVRNLVPIRGQRQLGLRQVPIDQIVGSVGRYRDFDRAFFPTRAETRDRWTNISRARYDRVPLPPVDLYRMGEVYFVKDGNHRVSVARERGQEFVDAHVVEIDVPLSVGVETGLDDLALARERSLFFERTGLAESRPELRFESSHPNAYERLGEHVQAHHWYARERSGRELSLAEAAASWADEIYRPMIELVRQEGLLDAFAGATEMDLYLWIDRYQDFLRDIGRTAEQPSTPAELDARAPGRGSKGARLPAEIRKLARRLARPEVRRRLLEQRWVLFCEQTRLLENRPEADLRATLPHAYDTLSEHVSLHRWYLGETLGEAVDYPRAALSWYDQVYLPLVEIVREQALLDAFPERTETDLYLWVSARRERLREGHGEDASSSEAARGLAEETPPRDPSGAVEGRVTRVLRSLGDSAKKRVE